MLPSEKEVSTVRSSDPLTPGAAMILETWLELATAEQKRNLGIFLDYLEAQEEERNGDSVPAAAPAE